MLSIDDYGCKLCQFFLLLLLEISNLLIIKLLYFMAIIKSNGEISGKIGPVSVYQTKHGTQVVRSYSKPNDPKTPKQLAHRQKFSLVSKGLSPLCKIIQRGFKGDVRAYRKVLSIAYREAITGEYPNFKLDYSKIKIAEGDVPLPANIKVEVDEDSRADSQVVCFTWDSDNRRDSVNIICLNEEAMEAKQHLNVVGVAYGEVSIELPKGWEASDTHLWLYLTSVNYMNSSSIYLNYS